MTSEPEEHFTFQRKLLARRLGAQRRALMEELDGSGLATRDIAALLGISVWRWRQWYRATVGHFEDLMRIAQLLAVLDTLEELGVEKPVAWLETPLLHRKSAVTPMGLYPGGLGLMLGLASGRVKVEEVLDIYDQGWRERPPSGWEVFEAFDGHLAIRRASS